MFSWRFAVCSLIIVTSAFINEIFNINAPVHFITKVGTHYLPRASLAIFALSMCYTLLLRALVPLLNRAGLVLLIHFGIFSVIFVVFSLKPPAGIWGPSLYYVFANVFYYATTFLVWGAVGRYFSLFEFQKHYPYFLFFHEGASVLADILNYVNPMIQSLGMSLRPVLFCLPLLLLGISSILFLPEHVENEKFSNRKLDDSKVSQVSFYSFISILGAFGIYEIISANWHYQFNTALEQNFQSPYALSRFLSLYQISLSVAVTIVGFLVSRYAFHKMSLFLPQVLMIAMILVAMICLKINAFNIIFIIIAFEFFRSLVDATLLFPGRDLIFSSMPEHIDFGLRNALEKIVTPVALFIANTAIILFASKPMFRAWNYWGIIVLLVAWSFLIYRFRELYYTFHLLNVNSMRLGIKNTIVKSVQALGLEGMNRAVPVLIELAQSRGQSLDVRRNAVLSLARIRSEAALRFLTQSLRARNESLQMAAIEGFNSIKSKNSAKILIQFLQGQNVVSGRIRHAAVLALNEIDNLALRDHCLWAIQSKDHRMVANGLESISHFMSEALVPFVIPCLSHTSARVRSNAILALQPCGFAKAECAEALNALRKASHADGLRSFYYIVGKLGLVEFIPLLKADQSTEAATRLLIRTSLVQLDDAEATLELAQAFVIAVQRGNIDVTRTVLHHFVHLKTMHRRAILDAVIDKLLDYASPYSTFRMVNNILAQSALDFKEEREILRNAALQRGAFLSRPPTRSRISHGMNSGL